MMVVHRRRAIEIALVAAVLFSVGLTAQKKNDKKLEDNQKKQLQTLVKLADDVSSGQGQQPNDLSLSWMREDYLKAQSNREYIPFVVAIDPAKVSTPSVALYWRAVAKNAAAEPAPSDKKDDKNKDKKGKATFAYEDVTFAPVTPGQGGPLRLARSITVPAGSYDILVVAQESFPDKPPKNAPAPKTSILKQALEVPDFWNGEFSMSTVIVAQRIDPLDAPLTAQQQVDRPYALGAMEIVPQTEMKISKKSELSTYMLIYNTKTDSTNKPDVLVEYSFYAKAGGNEKFFNKTSPQNLNKETLPPQFDLAAGHQLQTGQAVPLASFPEGDYRLEIKVTDKISNKTLTRDVNFTVIA